MLGVEGCEEHHGAFAGGGADLIEHDLGEPGGMREVASGYLAGFFPQHEEDVLDPGFGGVGIVIVLELVFEGTDGMVVVGLCGRDEKADEGGVGAPEAGVFVGEDGLGLDGGEALDGEVAQGGGLLGLAAFEVVHGQGRGEDAGEGKEAVVVRVFAKGGFAGFVEGAEFVRGRCIECVVELPQVFSSVHRGSSFRRVAAVSVVPSTRLGGRWRFR